MLAFWFMLGELGLVSIDLIVILFAFDTCITLIILYSLVDALTLSAVNNIIRSKDLSYMHPLFTQWMVSPPGIEPGSET
jgi:hypothetical protein